ncbi:MAG: tetratricopeptide repeat protein [Proteobacteria bacterium]|nr:tetratricopeptide repeat protein [Pseudomonadota bacterium]
MKAGLWTLAGLCLIAGAAALDPGLALVVAIVVTIVGVKESGLWDRFTAPEIGSAQIAPVVPKIDATGWRAVFLGAGRTKVVCLFPILEPELWNQAPPDEVDKVILFEGQGHSMPIERVKELYGDDIVRARVMGLVELPGLTLEPDHDWGEILARWRSSNALPGVDLCFDRIPPDTDVAIGTMKAGIVPDVDVIPRLKTVVLIDGVGDGDAYATFWSHMGVRCIVTGRVAQGPVVDDPVEDADAQERALITLLLAGEDEAFERIMDDRPTAQFQLGVLRCVQLRYGEALAAFERAAEGGMAEAWASVASMRRMQGDHQGALEAARAGVAAMPGDPISAQVLAHIESGSDDPTVQRFSAHARQGLELAAEMADRGEHDTALNLLRRARELDPRDAGIYAEHGALLAKLGRETQAEDLYRQGIDRAETGEMLRFNLGSSLLRQLRYDEAIAEYDRCLEVLPEWDGPRLNREAALYARDQV